MTTPAKRGQQPLVGSLCSGYTGLDMGLALALGAPLRHAWFVEYDGINKKGQLTGPRRLLDYRYPDVHNYGDVNKTDWAEVEPVDWLTAGYPCQPFSAAGLRKGADDPRHLWPGVARAISVLRPRNVLLENVRGHVSLGLDAVLGDLAELGYDCRWGVVRASDAGAPHSRARVFIVATDAERERESGRRGLRHLGSAASDRADEGLQRERDRDAAHDRGAAAADACGDGRCGDAERDGGALGPGLRAPRRDDSDGRPVPATPAAHACSGPLTGTGAAGDGLRLAPERGPGATPDAPSDGRDEGRAEPARIVGRSDAAERGGATPADPEVDARRSGQHGDSAERGEGNDEPGWGAYEVAIRRWERTVKHRAPRPTEPGRSGDRLSPRFVEWMMGLPAGWVTDVPGLSRNEQLKLLGNGVVPQQAALAVRLLTAQAEAAA